MSLNYEDSDWLISEDMNNIIHFTRMYGKNFLDIKLDHSPNNPIIFEGSLIRPNESHPSIFANSSTFYGCFDNLLAATYNEI